jgi:hypothetical protein
MSLSVFMLTNVTECTNVGGGNLHTRSTSTTSRDVQNVEQLEAGLSCCADMDGLLLNTESFYTIVQKDLLKQYGKEHTWELKAKA